MNTQTTFDLEQGRDNLRRVLETHEEATGYLTDEIDRRLCGMVPDGSTCTVDLAHKVLDEIMAEDVELGYPEQEFHRKFLANVFTGKPHWTKVDYRPTRRPERNAAPVAVWQLDKSKIDRED